MSVTICLEFVEKLTEEAQRSLAARIAAGDADAETTLLRLFWDRIRLMMRVRTGDPETARDLAQEAMLAVWQALRAGQLRDPERLAAFVHGIARNVANNYVRQRGRQPASEPLPPDLADSAAADAAQDAERDEALQTALAPLDTIDRRILQLTLVEGMKPREIGVVVGLSAENVRTRKSRALKKVIEALRGVTRSPADRPQGE